MSAMFNKILDIKFTKKAYEVHPSPSPKKEMNKSYNLKMIFYKFILLHEQVYF